MKGRHFRMLVDIAYLDNEFYKEKTNFKYIIDCIDHYTKFYWGYLIRDKKANTILSKINDF